MIEQAYGHETASVIRKTELSDIALQRLVLFGLLLRSDRSGTGSTGWAKLPGRSLSGLRCRCGLRSQDCLLLQVPDPRFGHLALLPNDRSDQADRGECDCYPSCTIHSSIRLIDSFAL